MKHNLRTTFVVSIILLVMAVLLAISLGSVNIPPAEMLRILRGEGNEINRVILLTLRLPRILEAGLVGAGLSVVGAVLQALFKNPMADPFVLGVSSGASLGATVAIIMGFALFGISFFAFLFSVLTIYLVYTISKTGLRISMTTMLLAGIAISSAITAIIYLIMLLNRETLSKIVFWTMGSFSLVSWNHVLFSAPLIILPSLALYLYSRDLNAIMVGEETAEHLGVDTELVKRLILVLSSLLTAATVAVCGIIGFVGLIIPHIARLLVGPDNRILVPFSAVFGAAFLILTDTMARILLNPAEIPAGIITAAFGGPFFLYLLFKAKRSMERM